MDQGACAASIANKESTNKKTLFDSLRENEPMRVQVASEMLPNSTERAVTVSGGSEALTQCIYNICTIMAEVIC